ncbi:hypothetical protein P618_200300 [Holospora obtusa F1]|uniref:Uncharacterized protein n=1 Tax=Holospora obtusa F1 TaxID=1399147 RepID=W6TEZ4_HOLOB|nr:hypothetical protein [Holospora obtusa]ETZ07511.1 hypothetical protein P618_200300 [Holospora obtusa F1]
MGSILHNNAKTTLRVRKKYKTLYGALQKWQSVWPFTIKIVLKWKKAGCVEY